jgi:hypothetical protein
MLLDRKKELTFEVSPSKVPDSFMKNAPLGLLPLEMAPTHIRVVQEVGHKWMGKKAEKIAT